MSNAMRELKRYLRDRRIWFGELDDGLTIYFGPKKITVADFNDGNEMLYFDDTGNFLTLEDAKKRLTELANSVTIKEIRKLQDMIENLCRIHDNCDKCPYCRIFDDGKRYCQIAEGI